MIEAVFFDVGGTLIHTDPRTWLPSVLDELGEKADWSKLREALVPAYEYYNAHHMQARSREEAISLWRNFDRMLLAGLGVKEPDRVADWLVAHWHSQALWPKTPGTPEVLETLKRRGMRLAAVSNWDVLLPEILEVMDLAKYFDAIVPSAAVGVAKPEPAIYRIALESVGVSPERVLFVGDNEENDHDAPRALGMHAVLTDPYRGLEPVLDVL